MLGRFDAGQYSPAVHVSHAVAPSEDNSPDAHANGKPTSPFGQENPAGHDSHDELLLPGLLHDPSGHTVDTPLTQY